MEPIIPTSSYFISSLSICAWRSGRSILVSSSSIYNQVTSCFPTWHWGTSMNLPEFNHKICFIDWIISLRPIHPIHCQRRPWYRHSSPGITPHQYAYDASNCSSSSSNVSFTQYHPRIVTIHRSYWMEPRGILRTFLRDLYCRMDCTKLCDFFIWVLGFCWWCFSHR